MTEGSIIYTDSCSKKKEREGYIFFFCGDFAHTDSFMKFFIHGLPPDVESVNLDMRAFVYDTKEQELWDASSGSNESMYRIKQDMLDHWAIGSGTPWAVAAMDYGSTAKEAVKYAMSRDANTGGKVNTYILK